MLLAWNRRIEIYILTINSNNYNPNRNDIDYQVVGVTQYSGYFGSLPSAVLHVYSLNYLVILFHILLENTIGVSEHAANWVREF